ncbi:MAG: DUF4351 domain-containing protein, partial [Leptolyngbyaceae bacterium]|nr:DUF4351 domain-containing protein [Leptolyngbyaceae bacterium]
SEQVYRIYLKELGEIEQLPLGVALMVLTTVTPAKAPAVAKTLIARAEQTPDSRGTIEMITTIMAYKFTHLSRQEIEQMLGVSLQETRVYQEAKAEGRQEGRQEGERSLLLRQLTQKFGTLSDHLVEPINTLTLEQLEALAIALLNFQQVTDLEHWLKGYR